MDIVDFTWVHHVIDRDALGVRHEAKDTEYHEAREHTRPAVYHRHNDRISENHNANINVSVGQMLYPF